MLLALGTLLSGGLRLAQREVTGRQVPARGERPQRRLLAARGMHAEAARYLGVRLGEPDAFPGAGPWLQQCLSGAAGRCVTPGEAEHAAEGWRPWRAYAAAHLWLNGQGHPA